MEKQTYNSPLVCLIMPVYNGDDTLKNAIASLLRQTYDNWFCIIVNDGSTDGTRAILDSIKDSRFLVLHLIKNRGRGVARDIGLSHATGKYLAYLDADDMIHKDKIRVQVDFLEHHPDIYIVGCGGITFGSDFKAFNVFGLNDFISTKTLKYGQDLPLTLPSSMIRFENAKLFSYNHFLDVGEDYDYFARYCEGHRYANIGCLYYYYRVGNVTAKKMLYYQINDMKSVIVRWKYGFKLLAIKTAIIRLIKLFAYSFLLLFFNTTKILNFRNNTVIDSEQNTEFLNEINHIQQLSDTF